METPILTETPEQIQHEPRPIMASRGANTVFKLSSLGDLSNRLKIEDKRKERFKKMSETYTNTAPELGRQIVLSTEMYGSSILKSTQKAKIHTKS